ncbi:hypothetical protein GCM10010495_48640 [Kitasatospora herbaricolor]|uniref:helix-turn-helix transcriptional regulator n=1 Tax=Kitasatospora herbaricolor TaxID=68217 RepID=UPI00174C0612|nr:helix-turn-helix transcriptional regulator [Kitasatospora herbaricolor]MDQ0305769.1 DNA-binding CsgD family transcriptional regulator [Kitasatospora herbaricolor]GGV26912.1 hypothetical protein GCM10010495_48640 [Kitasatospora herbaricolor]
MTAPTTVTGQRPADTSPARPDLNPTEVRLLRLVLAGANLARSAVPEGLTRKEVTGGRATVLAALGARTTHQAAGHAAWWEPVSSAEIGIEKSAFPVMLGPRVRRALALTAQGLTRQETAEAMGISEYTLVGYLAEARHRLGAGSLEHAVFAAVRRNVLTGSDLYPLAEPPGSAPTAGDDPAAQKTLPPAPILSEQDLALIRFALLPDGRLRREAAVGLPDLETEDPVDRVCCLLGATTLVQAAALTAAHRLLPEHLLGIAPPRPVRLSPRRSRAIALAVGGLTSDQIAQQMAIRAGSAAGLCEEATAVLGVPTLPLAGYAAVVTGAVLLSRIRSSFPPLTLHDALRSASQTAHTRPGAPS